MSSEPAAQAAPTPATAATPATPASPALQQLRAASIACTLALVVLALAWELWLAPTGQRTLAVKALPLALALPGLMRHRLYTYRWLSLLLWLYVLEGLLRSTTEGGISMVLAIVEVALALALFTATTLYIRRRLRGAPPVPAPAAG
jgi:uncharacterized membrane protein